MWKLGSIRKRTLVVWAEIAVLFAVMAGCGVPLPSVTPKTETSTFAPKTESPIPASQAPKQVPPTRVMEAPIIPTKTPLIPTKIPKKQPKWHGLVPEGARLRLGKGSIQHIALSLDGKLAAVGSSAGVCLYEYPSWREKWCSLIGLEPRSGVSSLALDPSGSSIAAGAWNGEITVWDADSGRLRWSVETGAEDIIRCLAWSPDGKSLLSGADNGRPAIWDSQTGEQIKTLQAGDSSVIASAWSPDGPSFATGDGFGEGIVWDAQTWERKVVFYVPRPNSISSLAWSPDGALLWVGESFVMGCGEGCNPVNDGAISAWDTRTGEEKYRVHIRVPVNRLALSPEGSVLAAGTIDSNLRLFDPESGRRVKAFTKAGSQGGLVWLPDGERLLLEDRDGRMLTLNVRTGERLERVLDGYEQLYGLSWSPDSSMLATTSSARTLLIWEMRTGQMLRKIDQAEIKPPVAWSPDGKQLVSGGKNVFLWDAETGKQLRRLRGHKVDVSELRWSPDGSRLASLSGDGQVILWDTQDWSRVELPFAGYSLAWSPDGKSLAVGQGVDGADQVIIWDLARGENQLVLSASGEVLDLSWQGIHLAAQAGGWAEVWDVKSGLRLWKLAHEDYYRAVYTLALSPDGALLATGAGEVILWETRYGRRLATLNGIPGIVTRLAFSPDGKTLAAESDDGTVLLWELGKICQKARC